MVPEGDHLSTVTYEPRNGSLSQVVPASEVDPLDLDHTGVDVTDMPLGSGARAMRLSISEDRDLGGTSLTASAAASAAAGAAASAAAAAARLRASLRSAGGTADSAAASAANTSGGASGGGEDDDDDMLLGQEASSAELDFFVEKHKDLLDRMARWATR